MTPTRQGSFHLFRLAGIDLYLHWSWFLVAVYAISARRMLYSSLLWNVLEYVALFGIVLMHEFGHALACRQVGGQANQIVLWPLGGVAYVMPPQRPGATLWSIAAGPLVNVALLPVLTVLAIVSGSAGWSGTNAGRFVESLWNINLLLLIFNMLPVYPLDGGQILRSLLWFVLGRARSLMVASIIGFVGVAALFAFAAKVQSVWIGILALFILINCWGGFQQARLLTQAARRPRHTEFACPNCRVSPPSGAFWLCGACRKPFDIFAANGVCPHCGAQFDTVQCQACQASAPIHAWITSASVPPRI